MIACGLCWFRLILFSRGREKAAVLPVPVCALPSASLPSRRRGIAAAWIGVGDTKPMLSRAERMFSLSANSLN